MPFYFGNPLLLLCWLLIPLIWAMLRKNPPKNRTKKQIWISGILRSVTVFVIGLALADLRISQPSEQINLLYCLDLSDSISLEEQQATKRFIEKSANEMGNKDQAGIIVFGKQPYLEQSLSSDFKLTDFRSQVNANFTNINSALQSAIGKFPSVGDNRIVLLTDGNQNLQNAEEALKIAKSLGVEIYPAPLGSWFESQEIYVDKLETPPRIQLETPFDIRLVITSAKHSRGEIILLRNGQLIAEETVDFQPGKNVFRFVDSLNKQGLFLYKSIVHAPQDRLFQRHSYGDFWPESGSSEHL